MKSIPYASKINPHAKSFLESAFITLLMIVIELILYFQGQYYKPCSESKYSYDLQISWRALQIQILWQYTIFLIFEYQDQCKVQDKSKEKMSIILFLISAVSFIGAIIFIFSSEQTQEQEQKCGNWIREIKENSDQANLNFMAKVFFIGVLVISFDICMYAKLRDTEQNSEESNKDQTNEELI